MTVNPDETLSINFPLMQEHIMDKTSRIGRSYKDFGYTYDIDPTTISRIMSKKHVNITVLIYYRICKALGTNMQDYIIDPEIKKK